MNILQHIEKSSGIGKKLFAVLLDPDKNGEKEILVTLDKCREAKVDLLLVGGSLLLSTRLDEFVCLVKENTALPVVLFPGGVNQVSKHADAILLLSLISGRNPDFLIGRHVDAAPILMESKLEIIPTGYLLIGNENYTTAQYISNTFPVPGEKDDIAMCTAVAGEMLGLKMIYLDAGSGAKQNVPEKMITRVKQHISVPLIVGGGIHTTDTAYRLAKAGADVLVVGNALEKNPQLISSLAKAVHKV